ncbi:hypothetical protein D9M68_577980 [compost metagenome]
MKATNSSPSKGNGSRGAQLKNGSDALANMARRVVSELPAKMTLMRSLRISSAARKA